ncbi:hypothetical protein [Sorangium sp. So ce861]|uniref:hypothetical protein n=1 Tax=Sorangium sp. So ce861 TaxID=3133323 RepID=UPI003F5EABB7
MEPTAQRVWYGWQHSIVLGGSLLLVPVALSAGSSELFLMSVSGLVFGGPIVHCAHDNYGKALASLGMNIGGALGGGLLGAELAGEPDEGDWVSPAAVGAILGGSLGLLAANIVDIAVLPYEDVEPERYSSTRLRLGTQVGFAPGGLTVGLGGTF